MINLSHSLKLLFKTVLFLFVFLTGFIYFTTNAEAASLYLSPSTGVYTANNTFTVKVMVNTDGKPINAADGLLSFNTNELSVVSVNRVGSIFNLWVTEPTFSNSNGTINFSGGLPSGYTGRSGNIMTITFRAAGAGATRVSFKNGSLLANDGLGTNILTSMNGGSYTIQAKTVAPEPEVIEYIAPANTPSAPKIFSNTHGDPSKWHSQNEAVLNWTIPSDVISVRTLLNDNPTSVPTKVYENPISNITLSDLDEGVSYFHLQFRNEEGWGRITHYRLGVDTKNPTKISVSQAEGSDLFNPNQILMVEVEDSTSEVSTYKVKIDNEEPFDYENETGSSTIFLPTLNPGYHSIIIEAFDQAGNSIIGTYSFTLESFDRPVFTDYPSEINEEVIPVIKGVTRPNSKIVLTINKVGSEPSVYNLASDETGQFIFIPEGTLFNGVYELSAEATDEFGAKSEVSETVRIAVQQPGYLRIGSLIVSVLSVIIPLLVLLVILVLGVWYLIIYSRKFRKSVRVEAIEAKQILAKEFSSLQTVLRKQESVMQESRRTKKLTKAESEMIQVMDEALQSSQRNVEKEIADITELAKKKDNN